MVVSGPEGAKFVILLLLTTSIAIDCEAKGLSWDTFKNLAAYTATALENKVRDFAYNTTQDIVKNVLNVGNKLKEFASINATLNLEIKVNTLDDTVRNLQLADNTAADLGDKAKSTEDKLKNAVTNGGQAFDTTIKLSGDAVPGLANELVSGNETLSAIINGTQDSSFSIMTSFSQSSIPSSLAVVKLFPSKFRLLSGSYLSRSTAFGIRGALGWLIRCDRPHRGVEYHHLNYNSIYSGSSDPHYGVPGGVVSCFGGVTTLNKWFGGVITLVAVTADVYLMGETAVKEYNEKGSLGQETMKSFVIVGSRWFGAFVGATLGNFLGSLVCTLLCCGNPIGEAIGSIVGYISGGIMGGLLLNDHVQTAMKGDVEYNMLICYNIMCGVFMVFYICFTCILSYCGNQDREYEAL